MKSLEKSIVVRFVVAIVEGFFIPLASYNDYEWIKVYELKNQNEPYTHMKVEQAVKYIY